jgi:putative transposase
MPWSENNKMDLRYAAIKQYYTGNFTKHAICEIYQISRPVFNKWLSRFEEYGKEGLIDHLSIPQSCPHKTAKSMEDLILSLNSKKGWLCKKIHSHLNLKYSHLNIPSKTTVHNILQRHDRTNKYKRRRKWPHPGKPYAEAFAPNDVMCADYKGDFLLGDRSRCYPLTITDLYSRSLLGAFGHTGTFYKQSYNGFERVFKEYGLPKAILTDNGVPFVNKGIDGISQLSVWWTELGIKHLRTQLSSPQQNAQHERMHREMKRLVTRPAGKNMRAQQRKLNTFRIDYNENLGHPAHDDQPPMSVYQTSERAYPDKIPEPEYPDYFEVRKVSITGGFRWENIRVPISHTLHYKHIGLEEIDDGLYKVWFFDRFLGFFDEIIGRIEDKPGRYNRKKA